MQSFGSENASVLMHLKPKFYQTAYQIIDMYRIGGITGME